MRAWLGYLFGFGFTAACGGNKNTESEPAANSVSDSETEETSENSESTGESNAGKEVEISAPNDSGSSDTAKASEKTEEHTDPSASPDNPQKGDENNSGIVLPDVVI